MQKKQLSVLVLIILCFLLGCNRETPKDESQQNYEDESNISKTNGEELVNINSELLGSTPFDIQIDKTALQTRKETETEVKGGKEKEIVHKTFPGYVLVEMVMTDDSWYVVRNTPGVTGFVGSHGAGSKPAPLMPEEINHILRSLGMSTRQHDLEVEVGETVKIIEGAFAGLEGVITEIDEERDKIKANIDMFGRETSTELDFDQIDKI